MSAGHPGTASAGGAPIDGHLARFLIRLEGAGDQALAEAVRDLSSAMREGHVCLDCRGPGGRTPPPLSRVVGGPGEYKPLVLDGGRLYLHRYWVYETYVADRLLAMAASPFEAPPPELRGPLLSLFPGDAAGPGGVNRQRLAAFAALTRRVAVVSGGPGTGKTTTLAGLLYLHLLMRPGSRVAMAAPTGKAASRMSEALRGALARMGRTPGLAVDDRAIVALRSVAGTTVHRLLGSAGAGPYFQHRALDPLDCDLLVVDEASMLDLALMAKLLDALPAGANLVLLGDRDQLASVEAGAVLGEIAAGFGGGLFPRPVVEAYDSWEPRPEGRIGGSGCHGPARGGILVQLDRSWRFQERPRIGTLAGAVNRSASEEEIRDLLEGGRGSGEVEWVSPPRQDALKRSLRAMVLAGYAPSACAGSVEDALSAMMDFRVLSPLKDGPFGVVAMNAMVEEVLEEAGAVSPRPGWYPGRQVLVTRNDPDVGLFNGDMGVMAPDAAGRECVAFPGVGGGAPRMLPASMLPEHETAFALTVHKSQGSEFKKVLLVIPDRAGPGLTRELVYTGLTRASRCVAVVADPLVLSQASARSVRRSSGLADRLSSGISLQRR